MRSALEVFNAAMAPLRAGEDDGTLDSTSRSLTVASYLAERAVAEAGARGRALGGLRGGPLRAARTLLRSLGPGGAGVVALLEQCSLLS